jgi:mannosyl-3-phosphoglycerate phosphatase
MALLVATDLDGCLLDEESYSHDAAREALRALDAAGVPLVLCSSKTRAEIEELQGRLGRRDPFVVENGGAVVIPVGSDAAEVVVLGASRDVLLASLREIAVETGAGIRGFSDLSTGELQRLTGLGGADLERARRREYDEPFLLEDGARRDDVAHAAARRGLRVTSGGRFHHLTGPTDKGAALRVLLGRYAAHGRSFECVALGDSANDREMLLAADRPIVVPRPGGRLDEALARALPGAERAPFPGPEGWNAAVLAVLRGGALPRVEEGREERA